MLGTKKREGPEACENARKGHAYCKQQPAVFLPKFAETGNLRKDVNDIGCAVRNVCQHSKQEQKERAVQINGALGGGQVDDKISDHNGRQDQVIQDAPGFPVTNSVSSPLADGGGFHWTILPPGS